MRQIKLLNTNLCALVDDTLFDYLNQFTWYLMKAHNNYYARTVINNQTILMHQLVLPSSSGHLTPDHINENGLDNQKVNLRLANRSQQEAHKDKINRICTSKYKGVRKTRSGTWGAYIKINQKQIHLGTFRTEGLAAQAYNKKAMEIFGEFAKLNEFNTLGVSNE